LADEPNLRLSLLRGKAIEGNHQAALRVGDLRQVVAVLTLMTGQERQIKVLVEIANMGLRNAHMGCHDAMDFAVGGVSLGAQPANADEDIIAVGRPWTGKALRLGRQQAHMRTGTRLLGTTTGPARHRKHLVEGLDGFFPSQIVAQYQHLAAVRTSWEFGLIDEALLGV